MMESIAVLFISPCTTILAGIFLILLTILIVLPTRTRRMSTLPGPYSPWNVLGCLLYFKSKGLVQYDMENRKKYGKVYGDWTGSKYAIITTDVDIIRTVFLKEAKVFHNPIITFQASSEIQSSALPFIYDYANWKNVRSIVTPTFSSAKLKRMSPHMSDSIRMVGEKFLSAAEKGQTLEMKDMFGAYTMKVISSAGFGLDIDPVNEPNHPFIKNSVDSIESFLGDPLTIVSSIFPILSPLARVFRIFRKESSSVEYMDNIIKSTINERKSTGSKTSKDLLQLLMDARMPEEAVKSVINGGHDTKKALTEMEVRAQSVVFMLAGYETTATTLTFMSYLLATHPEIQNKLCQEIDEVLEGEEPDYDSLAKLPYLEMCLHESMRLFPPILRCSRKSSEDISVKGYFIPKGSGVEVPIYALHRDPENWPNPEKFDPERFSPENRGNIHPCAHMPFSAGPRNCVGKRMALVAAKLGMASVLQKIKFETAPETQIPVQIKKGVFICTAEKGVVLKPVKR